MHERAFKVINTYPFPCMIFSLCRSTGVPIWYINQLKTPVGIFDIGIIRDETNVFSPCIGPHPELPSLGDNLVDTVAQARTLKPKTLPGSRVSWVVALPRAPLAQPLSLLCSRLLGSRN